MLLFHVTRIEHAAEIEAKGIVPSEGKVFTITTPLVANEIAKNQIFAARYAMFAIHPEYVRGAKIEADKVAELSAGYHAVIKTEKTIPARHCLYLGEYETQLVTEFDLIKEWMIREAEGQPKPTMAEITDIAEKIRAMHRANRPA